jgi:two-component system chemotaxis response regulator CheB
MERTDIRDYSAVVIGVSAGGMKALDRILPLLPADFNLPVIIVSHRHPDSDDYLEQHMNEHCSLPVKQADEKEKVIPGVIYFAPPNYHLLIEDNRTFSLSVEAPVNYARPSIDVLFESALGVFGSGLVGIVLTGANNDGSRGLKKIKQAGGLTIAQDPADAEVPHMPKAAIAAADPDLILPLEKIGEFLGTQLGETQ